MNSFTEAIRSEGESDLNAVRAIRQLLQIINNQFEALPGMTRFSMLRHYLQEYQMADQAARLE